MGRGLRRSKDKNVVFYHDFYHKTNHFLENHSKERIKTLSLEGHEILQSQDLDEMDKIIQEKTIQYLPKIKEEKSTKKKK